MSWQIELLAASNDSVIAQDEITGIISSTIDSAVQGMITVGIVSMVVKGFYGMFGLFGLFGLFGPKKYTKQEEGAWDGR